MVDTLDKQGPDFLEAIQRPNTDSDITSLAFSSRVLLEILREIRKAHPSQRCVIDAQFSRADKTLTDAADTVDIRFLAMGKPVLSQHLNISNNTGELIAVGLNEPVVLNAAGSAANGIRIPAGQRFEIPVEIEKIQIRLVKAPADPGTPIVINNGSFGADIPVDGCIVVYGWTIPQSDKDTTE